LHGLAFNLADVFAIAGDALLLSAVVLHGMRHRARLRESV
jgi:lipoprotein signal peptidase